MCRISFLHFLRPILPFPLFPSLYSSLSLFSIFLLCDTFDSSMSNNRLRLSTAVQVNRIFQSPFLDSVQLASKAKCSWDSPLLNSRCCCWQVLTKCLPSFLYQSFARPYTVGNGWQNYMWQKSFFLMKSSFSWDHFWGKKLKTVWNYTRSIHRRNW